MASRPTTGVSLPERYSVVRHVADGGMASVWEASDELLGRRVAVKVLSSSFAADPDARRRFTREARAAARLSTHPHVVTVYDAGEHDGQAFLVMALYPGGTVADRIKAGPVPRALALDWLEDAAGALDLAHAEGVVHRDVKPANLLLDAGDRVAVADFGIATAAWDTAMTSTGLVLGTLAYLAPEQRTGGAATAASDRYALGLVARQLLTGVRPSDPAPSRVVLPGAAEVVLQRATAEDPAVRPATCHALVEELETALGDAEPTAATQAAPLSRPRAAATPLVAGAGAHTAPVVARRPRAPEPAEDLGYGTQAPLPPPSRGGLGSSKALAALAAVALLLGLGAVLALAGGGDDAGSTSAQRTSTGERTTTRERSTSSAKSAPEPAASAPAESTAAQPPEAAAPASTKSRDALIAQNNAAYAATKRDPAAQVAPLQESVAGLCKTQDVQCAFALFNLAQALRLSGRPAEAIPLLERRLAFSDNQVGTVRQELAAARQAAGGAAPAQNGSPNGKGKGKDKDN